MQFYIPLILTGLFYILRIREFLIKRDTIPGPVHEKWSFLFLFTGGNIIFVCAIIEYLFRGTPAGIGAMTAGTLLILASFVIRNWAIRSLGRFWSVHVEIRSNHELIQTGPYRLIRHPVYTAALIEVGGTVILFEAYLTAILIALLIIPSILYRISIEEKELVTKFGKKYEQYQSSTGALFPVRFHAREQ